MANSSIKCSKPTAASSRSRVYMIWGRLHMYGMICGIGYMVCSVWSWYMVHGVRCPVYGVGCTACGVRYGTGERCIRICIFTHTHT